MAVYQISKIQIRRGKSRTGPGFPQLASGELGWSLDTQELYIGNGSISEGAPIVGNTKILTSKDIIGGGSGLVNSIEHIYKSQTGNIVTGPTAVVRKLQALLDDNVYVTSFGAVGDGVIDDLFAIQRSINQLFANVNGRSYMDDGTGTAQRATLKIPPGIFVISDTLILPSYTTIVGAGIDKSFIYYTGTNSALKFVADVESPYDVTRPRYINVSGVTIRQASENIATIGLEINNLSNSSFRDVKLVGNWTLGTSLDNKGISITNTENVIFNNVIITNFYYGLYIGDAVTNIEYNTGSISNTTYGVALGTDLTIADLGASNVHLSNLKFENINANGFVSNIGSSNSVTNCTLINVGGSNDTAPTYPQIFFTSANSSCSNIRSDRVALLAPSSLLPRYVPEVSGVGTYTSSTYTADLLFTVSSSDILRLPLRTAVDGLIQGSISYEINYAFSGLFTRQGIISITANAPAIVSSEEFTCDATSANGIKLDFTVAIESNSIVISYTNSLADNVGMLTYSYTSKF
jgi:hypothetical protein